MCLRLIFLCVVAVVRGFVVFVFYQVDACDLSVDNDILYDRNTQSEHSEGTQRAVL